MPSVRSFVAALFATLSLLALGACHSSPKLPAAGSMQADKYLFDHGTDAMQNQRWLAAREYFQRLIDTYPQSQYRQDAKLGVGDAYLGQNTIESNILAVNEFQEFLRYYPLNARADYAQFKLGMAYFQQILGPERDQTPARDALDAFDAFLRTYPNSALRPEVEKNRRAAREELSEYGDRIGVFYFRIHWYPGAIERFTALIHDDPNYSKLDEVYYDLAESYHAIKSDAQAIPYYDRLVKEFPKSEYPGARQEAAGRAQAGDDRCRDDYALTRFSAFRAS